MNWIEGVWWKPFTGCKGGDPSSSFLMIHGSQGRTMCLLNPKVLGLAALDYLFPASLHFQVPSVGCRCEQMVQ